MGDQQGRRTKDGGGRAWEPGRPLGPQHLTVGAHHLLAMPRWETEEMAPWCGGKIQKKMKDMSPPALQSLAPVGPWGGGGASWESALTIQ